MAINLPEGFSLLRTHTAPRLHSLIRSIWLFPLILTIVLLTMSVLKISGSSMGIYHDYFYGSVADSDLLVGHPRPIRSDEWLVNSQMTIAQGANSFLRINHAIGNGQDMSILVDAPYKEWSEFFKPHNLAFFVLPFDNAFAFRWWFMAYLLILACYFFVLELLPGKKKLAALISLGLFFSPFVQWWYLYGTLGSLYYSLFAGLFFIKILRAQTLRGKIIWGAVLAYTLIAFALVLYPPFQIPCALTMSVFCAGYLVEWLRQSKINKTKVLSSLVVLTISLLLTGAVVLTFLATRHSVVSTVQNTAYPGKRVVVSGHYDLPHLLSSNLSAQFQRSKRAAHYSIPAPGISNQSEASNFMFLMPFLFLPGLFLVFRQYQIKRTIDWPLLATSILFVVLLVRLFIPHLNTLFKLLLLNTVPQNRVIIGLGLLGLIHLVLFIRNASGKKDGAFGAMTALLYAFFVFIVGVSLGLFAKHRFPGFIGSEMVWLLALPYPVIIWLLLRGRYTWAVLGLLIFSVYSTATINPLYRGTGVITKTPLSKQIQTLSRNSNERWVTESLLLENITAANGAHSLSGVYAYPQLNLWKPLGTSKDKDFLYNRYAHVNFELDRNSSQTINTSLFLVGGGDNFHVATEPCSAYLRQENVHYLLTETQLNLDDNSCATLVDTVVYPQRQLYIYHTK